MECVLGKELKRIIISHRVRRGRDTHVYHVVDSFSARYLGALGG